jgi:ribose/xylose/arabinose/galactoside ABC-type transport system permease subunit
MFNLKNVRLKDITNVLRSYGVLMTLMVIIIITGIIEKNFFTLENFINILRQVSMIGIVACGMTFVIISGAFDLSVGSVISLSGVIAINTINSGGGELLAIIYALLIGLAVGLINGILISSINGRMGEAFIVTYGTLTVAAALAMYASGGLFIAGKIKPGFYKSIGQGITPIIIFLVIAAFLQFILVKTKFGRQMCFIGGNINAAKMSGIRVVLNRTIYFAISGVLASIAGIVLTSRVISSNPAGGVGFELDAIAAVVVGGTSMLGGKGSIAKTILGTIVIGVMSNALNILNITAYPQMMVIGTIIILAVALDVWNKRVKDRGIANEKAYK